MDENKNQKSDYDFSYDSENDSGDSDNAVPAWTNETADGEEESEEEENNDSSGHESLTDDQEVDIDEFEEEKNNPLEENDQKAEEEEGAGLYSDDDRAESESEEDEENSDSVAIAKSKVVLIKKLLTNIKDNSDKLTRLLAGLVDSEDEARISISETSEGLIDDQENAGASKIIEGVFDGENMIGPDGKQYSVPSNYASKSKLVEGDLLKLTITQKGTFVYKQIKPIERERVIGVLEKAVDGSFLVSSGVKHWRILTASVTYFKGEAGDEAIILVPRGSDSKWAAVENIIRSR